RIVWDDELIERIVLQPGDVLFLDNRKCLHGRESFDPRFDGFDRWLVRVYVKSDLWSCRDRLVGDYVLAAGQL
ncbi:MAG: TauD/TfdA family dioxygenase, partial [Candidatus Saccharimonadales bacterium]